MRNKGGNNKLILRWIWICAGFLGVFFCPSATSSGCLPKFWFLKDESLLVLSDHLATLIDAKSSCESSKSQLATLNDAENIKSFLNRATNYSETRVWTGANSPKGTRYWQWINGTRVQKSTFTPSTTKKCEWLTLQYKDLWSLIPFECNSELARYFCKTTFDIDVKSVEELCGGRHATLSWRKNLFRNDSDLFVAVKTTNKMFSTRFDSGFIYVMNLSTTDAAKELEVIVSSKQCELFKLVKKIFIPSPGSFASPLKDLEVVNGADGCALEWTHNVNTIKAYNVLLEDSAPNNFINITTEIVGTKLRFPLHDDVRLNNQEKEIKVIAYGCSRQSEPLSVSGRCALSRKIRHVQTPDNRFPLVLCFVGFLGLFIVFMNFPQSSKTKKLDKTEKAGKNLHKDLSTGTLNTNESALDLGNDISNRASTSSLSSNLVMKEEDIAKFQDTGKKKKQKEKKSKRKKAKQKSSAASINSNIVKEDDFADFQDAEDPNIRVTNSTFFSPDAKTNPPNANTNAADPNASSAAARAIPENIVHTGNTALKCEDLEAFFENISRNTYFTLFKQFEFLQHLPVRKGYFVSQLPFNAFKNRYDDIFPYDDTRIVLAGNLGESYINASLLPGYKKRRSYIASQGPTDYTVVDFWRMICEKKIQTVVMLCNTVEMGIPKCTRYWPEVNTTIQLANFDVSCQKEDICKDIIRRVLQVKIKNTYFWSQEETRQIVQIHYTSWPDHGVPEDLRSIVALRSIVNFWAKTSIESPILVHCSAGVGRTGTYIGMDVLFEEMGESNKIDVLKCVTVMRAYRSQMVQTLDQYVFVHKLAAWYYKNVIAKNSATATSIQDLEAEYSVLFQSVTSKEESEGGSKGVVNDVINYFGFGSTSGPESSKQESGPEKVTPPDRFSDRLSETSFFEASNVLPSPPNRNTNQPNRNTNQRK